MPGRGCLARKAERRAARVAAINAEAVLEPAAKAPRTDDSGNPQAAGPQVAALYLEPGLAAPADAGAQAPALADLSSEEQQKAVDLCRALYEACVGFGGEGCTVPQLGSHYKVQSIRKDACFTRVRLADIIKQHDHVFEMLADAALPGGWRVKLRPGAMAALPGEAPVAPPALSSLPLPPSIDGPEGAEETCQALRINVVHALFKRGGKAVLHDLGQEPKLVEMRKEVLHGRPLLQFIRAFPDNFCIEDLGNGNFMIELTSVDVMDTTMIRQAAQEFSVEVPPKGKGGCKGKAKGKLMMMSPMMLQMMMAMKGKAEGKGKFSMNPVAMQMMLMQQLLMMKGKSKGKAKGVNNMHSMMDSSEYFGSLDASAGWSQDQDQRMLSMGGMEFMDDMCGMRALAGLTDYTG